MSADEESKSHSKVRSLNRDFQFDPLFVTTYHGA